LLMGNGKLCGEVGDSWLLISTTVVVFSRRACGDLAYGQSLGNGTRLA
jgi:hypothetical protein